MAKKTSRSFLGRHPVFSLSCALAGFVAVFGSWATEKYYSTRFLPRTYVANYDISQQTFDEALTLITPTWSFQPDATITLVAGDQAYTVPSADLGFQFETQECLEELFAAQHQLSFLQFWTYLLSGQTSYLATIRLHHDTDMLTNFLQQIDTIITTPGRHPSITYEKQQIIIDPGQRQVSLDYEQTFAAIQSQFPQVATASAVLHISPDYTPLTKSQLDTIQTQASTIINKSIDLTTDEVVNFSYTINGNDLLPFLLPDPAIRQQTVHQLFTDIDALVSRPPQEPILEIDQTTHRATNFQPPLDGLVLDEAQFSNSIIDTLNFLITHEDVRTTITLPLVVTPPTHTLAEVNPYGIAEIIGFGESYYAHSIPGRVHNVATAASHLDGTIVAPGEEFSFNQAVGEVSAATGYKEGYIIQNGRSVLSAGGGVCQVSTTLFRALLDAGLNITLRRPHSYRVTYYELSNDPGFDATVYTGDVDLRFINDTDHHVLITATTDSQKLYMYVQIWGVSDGRTATITNYQKFNAVGAPPAQYIEDPSLAPGQVKQIDWAVGGLQTNFTHTVYNADGSIRSQKDYPSKYQAWSAKYLVGPSR